MATNVPDEMTEGSVPKVDCFSPLMITTNGIWLGNDPMMYALPLFLIQLFLITSVSRIIHSFLKHLRQPMFISEILAGLLLGPTGFSGYVLRSVNLFPLRSIHVLSSAADLGLVYFAFMVGVEMDINVLRQLWRKIVMIGVASIVVPFAATCAVTYHLRSLFPETAKHAAFYIYLAMALSITNFSVLARVLRQFHLVNSELGHVSASAAMVNNVCSWILVGVAVGFRELLGDEAGDNLVEAFMPVDYLTLCLVAYLLLCAFAVRPALLWLLAKTPEGEVMSDVHAGLILMGVPLAGLVADSMSIGFVLGALIYGVVVPCGHHSTGLVERMEEIVSGLLVPMLFSAIGLNMDFSEIKHPMHVAAVVCAFLVSCAMKLVSTTLVALYCKMPLHESLSLGLLMNTRSYVAAIIVYIAKDESIVSSETFSVLVVSAVVTTALIVPVVAAIYKPSRRLTTAGQRRRTLMGLNPGGQLRLVACVHSARNVSSMIAFLDLANSTKRSPVSVIALHLVELTGRASAMLITHPSLDRKLGGAGNRHRRRHHATRHHAQSEPIISAFETFEQHAGGVTLRALTSISPYSTMHEDICHVAADKQADTIILPFHKLQMVDGTMEVPQPAIRTVNQNVLNHAPCSVIILVDRGLGKVVAHGVPYRVALLFFGGPDDRRALRCACRVADHPFVCLTVVRFMSGEAAATDRERSDRAEDDEHVSEFRLRHLNDESIAYMETVASNGEDTVAVLRSMSSVRYDLFLVGRSQGRWASKLTAGLTEWSECPELGPVGDLLASVDFGMTASVAVVQQYAGEEEVEEVPEAPQKVSSEKKYCGASKTDDKAMGDTVALRLSDGDGRERSAMEMGV